MKPNVYINPRKNCSSEKNALFVDEKFASYQIIQLMDES